MKGNILIRAFTLIELLIVIAIITILAGILFPVFNQAKESAKQTVCMSNMRQLAMAIKMYNYDSEGTFPPILGALDSPLPGRPRIKPWIGYDTSTNPTSPARLAVTPGYIDSYVKNYDIRRCAMFPKAQIVYAISGWASTYTSSSYYRWGGNPRASGREFGPMSKSHTRVGVYDLFTGASENAVERECDTNLMHHHDTPQLNCKVLQDLSWEQDPPVSGAFNIEKHYCSFHRRHKLFLGVTVGLNVVAKPYKWLKRPFFSCIKSGMNYRSES